MSPEESSRWLPAYVGLFEVRPHANGLPVQLVGLLQTRVVHADQICQVDVHVEVIGGYSGSILLPRNDLVTQTSRTNSRLDLNSRSMD